MPLKEAYELLRREVLSLRRENAKLKEGTYVDADRLAHEKEIRKLRAENGNLVKERDRYRELWQKEVRRTDRIFSDREHRYDQARNENGALKQEVLTLTNENGLLRDQLSEPHDVIAKLKAQINRDFETSSLPSSSRPFHKKTATAASVPDANPAGSQDTRGINGLHG